jgi:hypothetical protein
MPIKTDLGLLAPDANARRPEDTIPRSERMRACATVPQARTWRHDRSMLEARRGRWSTCVNGAVLESAQRESGLLSARLPASGPIDNYPGENPPSLIVRALGAHGQSRQFGRVSPISGLPQTADMQTSKYPPAKPGALGIAPLKAALIDHAHYTHSMKDGLGPISSRAFARARMGPIHYVCTL